MPMASVFVSPEVQDVIDLHPYLDEAAFRSLPIAEQLERQAKTLAIAHAAGDGRVTMQIASWWPMAVGATPDALIAMPFSIEDARLTIAREHGFPDAEAVAALDERRLQPEFGAALDALLRGEAAILADMLAANPGLAFARSSFGHGATLLHYLGANGVESHRQVTPLNAAELALLLIEMGADRSAHAHMYGGGQTAHALAATSVHPHRAGVADALLAVLAPPL